MPITIAHRLKIARLQADLTQVQAAELVGLERNTISRYEAALRSPSALNLNRLARAYGKTLDWFWNEEDTVDYQEEPHLKEDPTQAILAADDEQLVQILANEVNPSDERIKIIAEYTRFIFDRHRG